MYTRNIDVNFPRFRFQYSVGKSSLINQSPSLPADSDSDVKGVGRGVLGE